MNSISFLLTGLPMAVAEKLKLPGIKGKRGDAHGIDDTLEIVGQSELGQTRPCGAPAAMSEAGGEADITGSKADVAILMSVPGGRADVNFGAAYDRV